MDHGTHEGHAGHEGHAAMFRDRLWISAALTLPVLVFSEMIQDWLGFRLPEFAGRDLVAPILGTAVFLYGGHPFLTGGVEEARARRPGMMLLIALALTVAFGASIASAFGWLDLEFWWELALLVDVMLLGHWMEMRALGQASSALEALASLLPDTAERLTEAGTEIIPLDELREGDVVLVRPGGRVPADGAIVDGEAAFDESMITGESRPVTRHVGDRVVGGTVSTDSAVRIRITAVGEGTTLAGIRRLVEEAQASRSRAQALADRAAALLFYVALTSAAITLVTWLAMDEPDQAMERTITVLVIACPHALGLAIPLVIAISTSASAREGILIKDRLALERMRTVDTVLMDKTGTLTTGKPAVRDVVVDGADEDSVFRSPPRWKPTASIHWHGRSSGMPAGEDSRSPRHPDSDRWPAAGYGRSWAAPRSPWAALRSSGSSAWICPSASWSPSRRGGSAVPSSSPSSERGDRSVRSLSRMRFVRNPVRRCGTCERKVSAS